MERDIIQALLRDRKYTLSTEKIDKLSMFSALIHETNQKFNLTGFKTEPEIFDQLLLSSIDPVCDIIVPRGTRFIDLGSGAGIPGVALGIYFDGLGGVLVESSSKKADFIDLAVRKLGLKDLSVDSARAEELAREKEYREQFDWCFSRAFAKYYVAVEIGAAFVRKSGHFYIYSNDSAETISKEVVEHACKNGLVIMSHDEMRKIHIEKGICFNKKESTPQKYPRKFAQIKKALERIVKETEGKTE